MDTFDYQSPSAYLILKHKLDVLKSNATIDLWLKDHPQESRKTLSELLVSRKVIFKNDRLQDLPRLSGEAANKLMVELQNSTLEIKDRKYRLNQYSQCFIGSDLVKWLIENKNLQKEEAISIGQSLLDHNLIQHVTDDHQFKDDFLFYRFNTDFSGVEDNSSESYALDYAAAERLLLELQNSSLEVKDRRYRLKQYRQCFVGLDLVNWLQENKNLLTNDAVSVGQSLLDHKLIRHVTDDHPFKNDFLFYYFKGQK